MQAIILAAGMGKRLKELTKDRTKCMVEVNGITLIERMLSQIQKYDISRVVIVVGYKAEELKKYISSLCLSVPVCYVENNIYNKTNNIYSLFLAEKYLVEEDTILFESDLIFEDAIIESLINDERPTLALVDKYESWMDGSCVMLRDDDVISKFIPGNMFEYKDSDKYYKTVNIYKFSKFFSQKVYIPFLKAYISALGENEYYEQVLRILTILDDPQIYAKRLNGEKWYEIDDVQDLDIAESIFADDADQYIDKILNRFGGYWRYPNILDFCFPQNNFFPTDRCFDEIKAISNRIIKNYPSGQSIIRLLASKDMNIDGGHVLITNGIEECFHVVLKAIADNVGVLAPANEIAISTLKNRAIVLKKNDAVKPSVEEIVSFYDDKSINALIVSNPNCHLGFSYDADEIYTLLEWTSKKNIYFILDETYIDFGCRDSSLMKKEFLESYNNLIILKNLSVIYGVPGLRLGFCSIADDDLLKKCQDLIPCWNIDSYAEFFLQIIGKYQKDFDISFEKTICERHFIEEKLSRISHLHVLHSETCFVTIELLDGINSYFVLKELLLNYGILVKDLTNRISENGGQFIRVSVRNRTDNEILISSLNDILNQETRVKGKALNIDDQKTFFDNRTLKELPHRYNYVIYQDSNPELALERDSFEKKKFSSFLNVKTDSVVLDIGCGVGRWGDYFANVLDDGKYFGIDFSESLLKLANEHFGGDRRFKFAIGSFQNADTVIKQSGFPIAYNIILINGVLMYINDTDINKCLELVKKLMSQNAILYIKESVGVDERFTLNHFYSKEMNSEYSAIYRSIKEYNSIIDEVFLASGYECISSGFTWDEKLSNRTETSSYYWIIKK